MRWKISPTVIPESRAIQRLNSVDLDGIRAVSDDIGSSFYVRKLLDGPRFVAPLDPGEQVLINFKRTCWGLISGWGSNFPVGITSCNVMTRRQTRVLLKGIVESRLRTEAGFICYAEHGQRLDAGREQMLGLLYTVPIYKRIEVLAKTVIQ